MNSAGGPFGSRSLVKRYYRRLFRKLGPQHWWPARTRLEVMLGAILTQNTSWANARRALDALRAARLLNLRRLSRLPRPQLEAHIRAAGFYRQKAAAIRNLLAWLDGSFQGSLRRMFARPSGELREGLLRIQGIGPETADAILLYAGRRPYFVADAYTRRILARHGLVPASAGYEAVQAFLHGHLPPDEALFNEYHALLVETGKRYCRRARPRCDRCPLEPLLPVGGRAA